MIAFLSGTQNDQVLLISQAPVSQKRFSDEFWMANQRRDWRSVSNSHVVRPILLGITYRYHRFSIECEQLELAGDAAATAYDAPSLPSSGTFRTLPLFSGLRRFAYLVRAAGRG